MLKIPVGTRTLLAKTCRNCGELKSPEEFAKVDREYKYLDTYCKTCHNLRSRPLMHKYQQEALEGATRRRQPWTGAELQELTDMVAHGVSGPKMAIALKRSLYSVYTMKNKLSKGAS